MFQLTKGAPDDGMTYCDVCQSWRYSPFSCGRDDCGRPETQTMQREVAKAVADLTPSRAVDQLEELLLAYVKADHMDREWYWLDEIENRIGRDRYRKIVYGRTD